MSRPIIVTFEKFEFKHGEGIHYEILSKSFIPENFSVLELKNFFNQGIHYEISSESFILVHF